MRILYMTLWGIFLLASCQKFYSCENCGVVVTNPTLPADSSTIAVYTLAGAPNACMGATVFGIYPAGIILNNADSVVVQVNVTKAGSFAFSTENVNNVTFAASGVFTNIGIQNVTLKGSGTPSTTGIFSFTPKVDNVGCSFVVTFTGMISMSINGGAIKTFNDSAIGKYVVQPQLSGNGIIISGLGSTNSIEKFQLSNIIFNNGILRTGRYTTIYTSAYNLDILFIDTLGVHWGKHGGGNLNTPMIVDISSLTATNAQGTFSGILDSSYTYQNKSLTITSGKFNVPIQ